MATGINLSYITPYSSGIINIINNILVPVLIAIAFIVFLWGVYKYFIYGAENETEKADGRKFAMWGVIGFVIILSLWGIVNLVMGTFGLSVGRAPAFPTIGNTTGGSGQQQYFSGGAPIGSTVYNQSTGATLGTVNSSGQIVSNGQVVGRMVNGQAVDSYGNPISGTTVGTTPSGSVCEGKATGSYCTVAGRPGTCDYNESNVFDCYATPGANPSGGYPADGTTPVGRGGCMVPGAYNSGNADVTCDDGSCIGCENTDGEPISCYPASVDSCP